MEKNNAFYYAPLRKFVPGSKPWYSSIPVGHNKLDKMLKSIFDQAGIDSRNISNHSLRATDISRMYQTSLPEKVIMERSGHLPKEGLRSYEHTSTAQIQSACEVLSACIPKTAAVNPGDTKNKTENNLPNTSISKPSLPTSETQLQIPKAESENDINQANLLGNDPGLKPLNFQGMTGCTFHIHVNYKK